MPHNLNQTDILDIQPQPPPLIRLNLCSVAVGKLQSSKAVGFLKARVANFLTFLKPAKEALKGVIQTAQDVLAGSKVKESQFFIGRPQTLKFKGLVIIGDGSVLTFPSLFAFLKGVVVKSARYFQETPQQPFLCLSRLKFVLVGKVHRSITPLILTLKYGGDLRMFGLTRQELLDWVQTITLGLLAVYVLWLDIRTRIWFDALAKSIARLSLRETLRGFNEAVSGREDEEDVNP